MEDVVAVDREAPGPAPQLGVLAQIGRQLSRVVPDEIARRGVERLQVIAAGVRDVHDSVVDERSELLRPLVHGPHPGQLQIANVAPVDLVERTVRLVVVGPMDHQPISGVGVPQHRVGNGDVVLRYAALRLERL